jgi:hypothetical protein
MSTKFNITAHPLQIEKTDTKKIAEILDYASIVMK